MAVSRFSSIQKYGLGIVSICLLWLVVTLSENQFSLEDMNTTEGKVISVEFNRSGKYAADTVLLCTLENGRKFYANNYFNEIGPREFSDRLKSAKTVKLWIRQENVGQHEAIIPVQLVVDGVMYMDFKKDQSTLPDSFWVVIAGIGIGILFIFENVIRRMLFRLS